MAQLDSDRRNNRRNRRDRSGSAHGDSSDIEIVSDLEDIEINFEAPQSIRSHYDDYLLRNLLNTCNNNKEDEIDISPELYPVEDIQIGEGFDWRQTAKNILNRLSSLSIPPCRDFLKGVLIGMTVMFLFLQIQKVNFSSFLKDEDVRKALSIRPSKSKYKPYNYPESPFVILFQLFY